MNWRASALCAQTDTRLFYPEHGEPVSKAKAVCQACPVRIECLEDALDRHERFGVWGGLTEKERRPIREARAAARRAERAARRAERVAKVKRLHAAGLTRTQICQRIRASYSTVGDYLREEAA